VVGCFVVCDAGATSVHANDQSPQVTIQSISPASGGTAGQPMSFDALASGFTNPSYSLTDDFSGSSISSGDISDVGYFSWTPAIADAGTHHVTVTVTDAYNDSASTTALLYVIPDTIAIQNLLPGTQAYAHEPVTFTVYTPGFMNPWFIVRDSSTGSTVSASDIASDGIFTWYPATTEQGLHDIVITAIDTFGHSASVTQPITVSLPIITIENIASSTDAAVGSSVTFSANTTGLISPSFAITDSLGKYSTVSINNISTSTGAFSWTPVASDIGTHLLTLSAIDTYGGTASAEVTVVVDNATTSVAEISPTISSTATSTEPTTAAAPSNTSATSTTAQQDGYAFTRYLVIGSRGTDVTELQKHLTVDDFYSGPITGYFGQLTFAGVQRFQSAHNIAQVGVVGPQTRAALNAE